MKVKTTCNAIHTRLQAPKTNNSKELIKLIKESRKTYGANGVYIFFDDINKYIRLKEILNEGADNGR